MDGKFTNFTDNELYILKRMCIESSSNFFCENKYENCELDIHSNLQEMIHKEIDKRNDR